MLKPYSQRDPRWANLKINGTKSTMGKYGCFITALAIMCGKRPDDTLKLLEDGKCFSKDLVISDKAAITLGLNYKGKSKEPKEIPCIAEVDFSPSPGKQQHFVVFLGDSIIDTWTGTKIEKSLYKIENYRLFYSNEEAQKEELGEAYFETLKSEIAVLRDELGHTDDIVSAIDAEKERCYRMLREEKEKKEELEGRINLLEKESDLNKSIDDFDIKKIAASYPENKPKDSDLVKGIKTSAWTVGPGAITTLITAFMPDVSPEIQLVIALLVTAIIPPITKQLTRKK